MSNMIQYDTVGGVCEYEEWDKANHTMGICGKPAFGKSSKKGKELCEEHWRFYKGMKGIADFEVTEVKNPNTD